MVQGLWQWLSDLLGPASAEAKVVGSPEAMRLLRELMVANEARRGEYLPEMYQQIYRAAERHPRTVSVQAQPGLMSPADPGSAVAEYVPGRDEIWYDPSLAPENLANVLPHELLHFLNAQSGRPQALGVQHALIRQLLGTSTYQPAAALRGYQPGALSPVEQEILRGWFGGK